MSNDVSQYSPSQMAIALMEERRDMNASFYISYGLPVGEVNGTQLSELIKTFPDLYEYLLLDTQNSGKVTTTKIAEAISSLQTYINRCRDGHEPEVINTVGSVMANESLPGGFLYDWEQYNQAYSTWAGKARLLYYPSTYISPALRYNKTSLFKQLEQTISQGKINVNRINEAFVNYLTHYETLANLKTISAYQVGNVANQGESGEIYAGRADIVYFVGRTREAPYEYYYRACNMGIRIADSNNDSVEDIPASAWGEWSKIGSPVSGALNDYVSVFWLNSRLFVCWLEAEYADDGSITVVKAKVEYLNTSGQWCSYREIDVDLPEGIEAQRIWGTADPESGRYTLFVEATGFALYACQDNVTWGPVGNTWAPEGFIPRNMNDEFNLYQKVETGDTFTVSGGYLFTVQQIGTTSVTLEGTLSMYYEMYDIAGLSLGRSLASLTADNELTLDYSTYPTTAYIIFKNNDYTQIVTDDPDYRLYVVEPVVNNTFTTAYFSEPYLKLNEQLFFETSSLTELGQISTRSGDFFAKTLAESGIAGLLSYDTQTQPIEVPYPGYPPISINFNNTYGIYFWEIFFYISFLIADRYVLEQNYDAAAQWYKYIFSSSGYRNADGTLDTIDSDADPLTPEVTRYWNVVPLQTDTAWNTGIPETDDPDAIAMNDPMHFKMAVFLKTVNMLLERGDYCYRQLNRDMLTQARMYYLQASQLLGTKPVINDNNSWPRPTLGDEANTITSPATLEFNEAVVSYLQMHNGHFLPPPHEEMLLYWDKLEVRAYNLRNNLTLDGQPMSLPIYAEPVSPTQLQQNHTAGNGSGGGELPIFSLSSEFRFSRLLERARTAVGNVIQFGAELLSTLEKSDNESMTLLLQTQQQAVLKTTGEIQDLNLQIQNETLNSLTKSREGAVARQKHYDNLYADWISSTEQDAMNLQTAAGTFMAASFPFFTSAGLRRYKDQGWGNNRDYGDKGAKLDATATIGVVTGAVLMTAADRLTLDGQYRRRREEWDIQNKNAQAEVAEVDAQILAQQQQIAMAKKQIALNELERANQDAVYNLQVSRFTGASLQNWMSGRLSALYYQLYDATLSLCQATNAALSFEIGTADADYLLTAPVWNDLYQGLLAGEGLLVELQRMENKFLFNHKRGLEVQKNVSLNTVISTHSSGNSLSSLIASAMNNPNIYYPRTGEPPVEDSTAPCRVIYNQDGSDPTRLSTLVIELKVDRLQLSQARGNSTKKGRFYNIAVTLPGILGPYQDVDATLALQPATGSAVTISLSQGADDSGMFVVDASTADKYLPFEGLAIDSGTLLLSFYHADAGSQHTFVTALNDAIYQLRYTLKDA